MASVRLPPEVKLNDLLKFSYIKWYVAESFYTCQSTFNTMCLPSTTVKSYTSNCVTQQKKLAASLIEQKGFALLTHNSPKY